MAGAGYKLYSTGDVLTASDVNTYIQQQTVMVFADASARTTALSGVVAEGMLTYLKDTDVVQYYSGSGWVTVNTDQTPLTTKGDLFTYSTQDARLAVGNNGETLVADSSASTGLRWQGNFAAGKNGIINGNFDIWQRGTSSTSSGTYNTADRYYMFTGTGTITYAQESTIVPTGSRYCMKVTATGANSAAYVQQFIETANALRFAGNNVTLSAKVASSASVSWSIQVSYSTSVDANSGWTDITATSGGTLTTTSTTFQTISGVYAVPSTAKSIRVYVYTGVMPTSTVGYIGQIQLENGNVATAFQTATGTLAGELAACQRYYYQYVSGTDLNIGSGTLANATTLVAYVNFPVTMRTTPTLVASSGVNYYVGESAGANDLFNSFIITRPHTNSAAIYNSSEIAGTSGYSSFVRTNNASSSVAFSAEL